MRLINNLTIFNEQKIGIINSHEIHQLKETSSHKISSKAGGRPSQQFEHTVQLTKEHTGSNRCNPRSQLTNNSS